LAKKSRTPPPPRRVQAPKQRHTPRKGIDGARRRSILYGVGALGLIGVVAAVVVVLAGGGNSEAGNPQAVAATMRAAGCTLKTSKAAPSARHIADFSQAVTYSTYPPTSGRHYYAPAIWGNYTQTVDPRQAVHNEEHGGLVIWIGPKVSASERQRVTDFYDESPDGVLVTPIENTAQGVKYPPHAPPGSKIYLTAWTAEIKNGNITNGTNVIATCPRFNEKAFAAFRDEFRGNGPEHFPVSTLRPGT
jgi:hypothetical protein